MREQKTRTMKTYEIKFYDLKTRALLRTVRYQSTCRPTNWARHQRNQGEDSSIKEIQQ
jgi:hypothetical protein